MEAEELAGFMAVSLQENGALMARLCEGELKYAAQLDDYAFYALGLLELYSADFDPAHILRAEELAENIRERFADEDGGYFRTAIDAEKLIVRPKGRYSTEPCRQATVLLRCSLTGSSG